MEDAFTFCPHRITSYHHSPLLSQNLWEFFVTRNEKERSRLWLKVDDLEDSAVGDAVNGTH